MATAGVVETQRTDAVTSCVDWSLSVAVARNAMDPSTCVVAVAGVTSIAVIVAAETVTVALALAPLRVAVITAGPAASAVTRPPTTVAVAGALLDHCACADTSAVVPFEQVPVATKGSLVPMARVATGGVIARLVSTRPPSGRSGVPPVPEAVVLPVPSATPPPPIDVVLSSRMLRPQPPLSASIARRVQRMVDSGAARAGSTSQVARSCSCLDPG